MHFNLLKFADSVKCYKAIHNLESMTLMQCLQLDVDSLCTYFNGALLTCYPLISTNELFYSINLLANNTYCSILEFLVNCFRLACCVTALTAMAVA